MSEKENEPDVELRDYLPEEECFSIFVRKYLGRIIEKAMIYISSKPHVVMALYPHYCRWNGDRAMHSMAIVEIGGKHYPVEIDVTWSNTYIRSKDFGIIEINFDWSNCKPGTILTQIPNEPGEKETLYHGKR